MGKQRKQHSARTKFRVSLTAAQEIEAVSAIASRYEVAPTQVSNWKQHLLKNGESLFEGKISKPNQEDEKIIKEVYEQIGRLQMEVEWLKKNLPDSVNQLRSCIDVTNREISIRRQCELVGLNRSSYYFEPARESEYNLLLMELLDKQYQETPFWGRRKMTLWLEEKGHRVNVKRVARLMRLMGIEAIYPKPKTTNAALGYKISPYLLRNLEINRPDLVWCTDITYIPMAGGYMYLVAVMDWYSRYVVSWQLSSTMDVHFCVDALRDALRQSKPQIFNSDQGSPPRQRTAKTVIQSLFHPEQESSEQKMPTETRPKNRQLWGRPSLMAKMPPWRGSNPSYNSTTAPI